ncbi:phosphonate C-P lyase system protein PhnH [Actibacterium atlanticum]|uniref:phosphonate C-P lyase system protein PhnH n=1 Tax=Actibacterium atlanticum TaxID=1461693 RepID=UPI0005560648|nr:phosphonate C-P lyase system protein PhnH [Actibacterium atlanticum]
MQKQSLIGGFSDAPKQSAQAFRAAMNAMARPGRLFEITGAQPPVPLSVAGGALVLTLADTDTPLFLAPSHDVPEIRDWIAFHTGAPIVPAAEAMFALGDWSALQPLDQFAIGTSQYPDRSATLIVEQPLLKNTGAALSGPGIEHQHHLNLPDLQPFQNNAMLFPLGLDFYFTAGTQIAALPRSTQVTPALQESV